MLSLAYWRRSFGLKQSVFEANTGDYLTKKQGSISSKEQR